jgi:hypothetical protein
MTLEQLLQEVNRLTEDDLRRLQEYIKQKRQTAARDRTEQLMKGFDKLREGLSEKQLEELEWAINVEYVESPDKNT